MNNKTGLPAQRGGCDGESLERPVIWISESREVGDGVGERDSGMQS